MLVYEHIAAWEKKATNVVCVLLIVGAAVILIVGSSFPMVAASFFGVVLLCAYFVVLIRVIAPDMMRKVLPVPDDFYKPLGVFDATVRNVAPHVVEVETDSGAVLFVDADACRRCRSSVALAWRLTRLLSSLLLGRGTCALMAWVVSWTPASASVRRAMGRMLLWVTSRAASGAVRRVFTR